MGFQALDIVMLRPELGAKIFAVTEVRFVDSTEEYIAVRLDKGPLRKRFRLVADQVLAKIGTLDATALDLDAAAFKIAPSEDWQVGQAYAAYMARRAPREEQRRQWAFLASLTAGEAVAIRRQTSTGARIETHRFLEVLPRGQVYNFAAANANGTVYRWTLDSLHLEGSAKANPASVETREDRAEPLPALDEVASAADRGTT